MLSLGKKTNYKNNYDPSVLFAISREEKREEINIRSNSLPFSGYDLWNCYELTWLNADGKPEIALAELIIPCESPNLIESKSLKLYLGSFGLTKFKSKQEVEKIIKADLEKKLSSKIKIRLLHLNNLPIKLLPSFQVTNLDNIKI